MTIKQPKVTVLLAVYNGGDFVANAIDSILTQTFSDFELLIVDDGSSDDSRAVIQRYGDPRVRVIRNLSNIGLTRSLNIGLAAARGELIARQDADDVSYPDRLRQQVAFLDANPAVALVGAQARGSDPRGRRFSMWEWPKSTGALAVRWQVMFDSPFLHTATMFRRQVVWEELGGYNEAFRTSQDYELWSRIATRYDMRNLATTLVESRPRHVSVSKSYRREDIGRVRAVILENRRRWLSSDYLAMKGLDEWVSINNPDTMGRTDNIAALAQADSAIFARFAELYPEARHDREIRRHRAASLARAAALAARQGSAGAAAVFFRAALISPTTVTQLPRFTAQLLLGWRASIAARRRKDPI